MPYINKPYTKVRAKKEGLEHPYRRKIEDLKEVVKELKDIKKNKKNLVAVGGKEVGDNRK